MKSGLVSGGPDRSAVAAAFDARTDREARADFLLRETELRMFDRLGFIRVDPVRVVLDVGCGLGDSAELLGGRFDGARYIGLDLSLQGLREAARAARAPDVERPGAWKRWLARAGFGDRADPALSGRRFSCDWVVGDAQALPIATGSVDLVWSNLSAHWFDDPVTAVAEWRRVLRPGGLLMFSLFGVDTLRELRPDLADGRADRRRSHAAGVPARTEATIDETSDQTGHTTGAPGSEAIAALRYPDLHDWGDALVAAGFADPVMDVERLVLTYSDAAPLARDMAAIRAGFGAPLALDAVDGAPLLPPDGAVSIELIFGHAWRPLTDPRDDGLKPIRIARREELPPFREPPMPGRG